LKRQLLLIAAAACAVSAMAQTDLTRTVAVVNGEEIKGPEYYRRMEFLPNVGMKIGNSFAEAAPGFLTLDQLINERLMLQLAKEKGAYPTDAEVQAEIKMATDANPNFLQQYAEGGGTTADLQYQIRLDLARFKLQTRGVVVTDQEVDQYYKNNPNQFTIPKTVEVRVIIVDTDAARALVDADLKAGKAFEAVARERSVDLSKGVGGKISARPADALGAEAKAALDKIKVGQVSEWVPARGVYTKMLFEKANPSRVIALDARIRTGIRRQLMMDRGRVKPENDIMKMMANMRSKANIEIKDKQFAETFKRMKGSMPNGG
jgi:hypothetical protein